MSCRSSSIFDVKIFFVKWKRDFVYGVPNAVYFDEFFVNFIEDLKSLLIISKLNN